ncbi:DODA-type extradiol aromatic ring-opening family dioxygenase [Paenibacillus polymyxa]|uniref:DODA-type extradiol aromatic ring-opening family dioxygenase n=1 Tax=Paenibacillus TaxID=44249 RepID=UPI0010592B9E|nr:MULTISPECIES: class III extradiol ring-cleavage dioxygenase [Paenibacillus]TDL65436.1 dioxygenase [Paenibacillus amylolyticus]WJM08030.1 class III extradiol ring-cleavage dioxygenase [Paenibacillus sp. PK1-4R]
MMPSLFIAHGAPSLALEENVYTEFLQKLGQELPKPKAIVLFSAHWESTTQLVSSVANYETIYDFGGFQPELYQIKYPAQGQAETTAEVERLFAEAGIPVQTDDVRGLDHGAWVVLRLLYPDADIPVIALSVNRYLTGEQQYQVGQALASLREQDILVIGSGGTVHNLRRLNWESNGVDPWASEFDNWLHDKLVSWDTESLFSYDTLAPSAQAAVPTPEHFVPLLLAMGAGHQNKQASLLFKAYQYGNLSLSCWKFD